MATESAIPPPEFAPCPPLKEPTISCALEEGRTLLYRWVTAVENLDPVAAASLYAENETAFWGTFGDHCRLSRAEAQEYFERFLEADSVQCVIKETHWRALAHDAVLATGCYEFHVARHGGSAQLARARFTFAFRRMPDASWQIVEHHSSLFPENGF